MRPVWSAAEARAADAAAASRVGEGRLIQRAAAAVATTVVGLLGGAYGRHVVVVAGKGHNGADALWAGVRLRERGARVDVVLPVGEPADEHGARPLDQLRGGGSRVVAPLDAADLFGGADVVLDGLLGVGARPGPLPWPEFAGLVATTRALVVAVDLPSGLDADGAAVEGVPRADVTVTFGAAKAGCVVGAGRGLVGELVVAEIGLRPATDGPPRSGMLDADDIAAALDRPERAATKYTRGVVGVVAGSAEYAGAAALACAGALAGGAGFVRLFAPGPVLDLVRSRHPEVVGHPLPSSDDPLPRVDRWVVGPGLGAEPAAAAAVGRLLRSDRPLVLDADGLALAAAAGVAGRTGSTLITPHAGELARLLGIDASEVAANPLDVARSAAADLGCLVLLKGDATVVAAPDGTARINPTGTPWLASAGTGDVLAGLAGALWRGDLDTAATAPWLHGLAGRLAAGDPAAPLTGSRVAECLTDAVRLVAGDGR